MEAAIADITLEVRQRLTEVDRQQHLLQQRIESAGHAAKLMVQLNARRDLLIDGTQVSRLYLDELLTTQARLASAEGALLDAIINLKISRIGLLRATSSIRNILLSSGQSVAQSQYLT